MKKGSLDGMPQPFFKANDGFINFLKEPNENQWHLGSLVYGSRSYQAELAKGFSLGKIRLIEKNAYILLHKDPTGVYNSFWEPVHTMSVMVESPLVADKILKCLREYRSGGDHGKIRRQLERVCLGIYMTKVLPRSIEAERRRNKGKFEDEAYSKKCVAFFENYIDRFSGCLLNHSQIFTEEWIESMVASDFAKESSSKPKVKFL